MMSRLIMGEGARSRYWEKNRSDEDIGLAVRGTRLLRRTHVVNKGQRGVTLLKRGKSYKIHR